VSIVLDASTALAAILPDEDSAYARSAILVAASDGLVVPTLWQYEIQNGLLVALRRNRIDARLLAAALDALRGLRAVFDSPAALGRELHLASAHRITANDAAYLSVAMERGAMLATNDKRLRDAAEGAGVGLFAMDV
jgi:predicted nucleic acid-binding protein